MADSGLRVDARVASTLQNGGRRQTMARIEKVITITGMAPWTIRRDPDTGRYVGSCDVLNLSTEGDTWNEITIMTQDAVRSLFDALYREGDLEDFLKQRGFSIDTKFVKKDEPPEFDIMAPIFFTPVSHVA